MLPPCPHCGMQTGVYRAARARGRVMLYYDENGLPTDAGYDKLEFVPYSAVVRCDYCNKIRRDVVYVLDRKTFESKVIELEA